MLFSNNKNDEKHLNLVKNSENGQIIRRPTFESQWSLLLGSSRIFKRGRELRKHAFAVVTRQDLETWVEITQVARWAFGLNKYKDQLDHQDAPTLVTRSHKV